MGCDGDTSTRVEATKSLKFKRFSHYKLQCCTTPHHKYLRAPPITLQIPSPQARKFYQLYYKSSIYRQYASSCGPNIVTDPSHAEKKADMMQ